ncbi:MAG: hypothetical protein AVDCRST_MAG25-2957 [uncultured Rubrobacteraceae bacterium]|uniref:DUF4397 domain-containing protein n=1 Tax=uncultured Rubrobacteraceae bacterium TaxID=349277 RepID=A0A6J4RX65_9ACTN|nr:MAG: hypothetical protein AVDCRST_MAG25-2957 [uncultured Rubrobacteraceae bacterium]
MIDAPVELAAGNAYTVATEGPVADGSLTANICDVLSATSNGNARVRVVNASPAAGPVDAVPAGGETLVSGLAFPNAAPSTPVSPRAPTPPT